MKPIWFVPPASLLSLCLQAGLVQNVEPSQKMFGARDPINPARATTTIVTAAHAIVSPSVFTQAFSFASALPATSSSPMPSVKADDDNTKTKFSKKAAIGIGVGIPGAFLVSGGIVFLCYLCRGEPRGRAHGAGGGLTGEARMAAADD